ncbi:unnamed protein product [Triticum turgidum subsp. durum]|uniref:Uncharacterized protein n=1 Tax=Triticum turgidum subsp. durum TaxID=4567 RepID=A0A9R1BK18_TRITD|nr:unnamed protein product [Triticum turgidum subsp. durum]
MVALGGSEALGQREDDGCGHENEVGLGRGRTWQRKATRSRGTEWGEEIGRRRERICGLRAVPVGGGVRKMEIEERDQWRRGSSVAGPRVKQRRLAGPWPWSGARKRVPGCWAEH